MSDRIPNTDSDDAEEERRERYNDDRPSNESRMIEHFAQLDRRDRTGPNH